MQQSLRPIEKQQQQIYVTLPKNGSNRNDTSYLSMWERDICKLARLVSRISRLISSRVGTGPTRAK